MSVDEIDTTIFRGLVSFFRFKAHSGRSSLAIAFGALLRTRSDGLFSFPDAFIEVKSRNMILD